MKSVLLTFLLLISVIGLVLVTIARLGYWPVNATAVPSGVEWRINQSILQASLNRQAQGLTNPVQPTSDVLRAGMKIFKMNCAGCHGQAGQPSQWGTKGFYPRVPQFGDQPPPLSGPQMFIAIKRGIRYTGMGAWDGMLSDDDIWKVSTFLEHIGSLPPEVQADWKTAQ
ncbi:MAG TPA: c-type cytochrome [Chthoniobacterales bacterium]|nr:c-type cytochrome [Chthoniobacterales bacterium]